MSIFKKHKEAVVEQEVSKDKETPSHIVDQQAAEIIDEADNVDQLPVIDPEPGEGTPIEEVEDIPEVIVFEPHHVRRAKLEYQII
jgi:hypothetical protein